MKAGPVLLLTGAGVCFALALADQLSSGELYRRASSMRTDREGSSVWFEALARSGSHVERNYAPLDTLQPGKTAVILLAFAPGELKQKENVDALERLAKGGARVAILFEEDDYEAVTVKSWGLEVRPERKPDDDDEEAEFDRVWRDHFIVSPEWHVVRALSTRPVVVERNFGQGSLAIAAATRPFLNESLKEDRDLALLDWAQGGSSTVLFDESHLGSARTGTIVGLIRRFHLQGVAAALIAASLLFVWRASVPFPPVLEANAIAPLKAGTSSGDALRNLLERRIPPQQLISVCVAEWSRDFSRRVGPAAVEEVSRMAQDKSSYMERWERIRGAVRGKRTS